MQGCKAASLQVGKSLVRKVVSSQSYKVAKMQAARNGQNQLPRTT